MKKQTFFSTFFLMVLLVGLSSCEHLLEIIDPPKSGEDTKPGHVFTMSNAKAGNEIITFMRNAKGELQATGTPYLTGGKGTGAGLGSQGALVLQQETKLLFAVNAGSNEISVLKIGHHGLELIDIVASGGKMPVSLTVHKNVVYVVHAGEKNTITGFMVNPSGKLHPIPHSTRYLSAEQTGPAQVQFSPDGKILVVTEKMTNKITTFVVDNNGLAGETNIQAAAGETPFGFYFRNQQLIVSEAFGGAENKSAVSSYQVSADGMLTTITPSAATHQTAACWIAIPKNGKYAYTTNAGSGSITGYTIAQNGSLSLLDANGRTGITGEGPVEMALSNNSHYLFNLNSGTKSISSFRIKSDGSLEWLQEMKGLPAGVFGLAAM